MPSCGLWIGPADKLPEYRLNRDPICCDQVQLRLRTGDAVRVQVQVPSSLVSMGWQAYGISSRSLFASEFSGSASQSYPRRSITNDDALAQRGV